MTDTLAEKLLKKLGQKVTCDFCHQKKKFNLNWRMNTEKKIACEFCLVEKKLEIGATVSI